MKLCCRARNGRKKKPFPFYTVRSYREDGTGSADPDLKERLEAKDKGAIDLLRAFGSDQQALMEGVLNPYNDQQAWMEGEHAFLHGMRVSRGPAGRRKGGQSIQILPPVRQRESGE